MGNKMTSTPYGLKVKEHTNHVDYKDIFDDTVFKVYYNESTHVWTIKANYDRLWSDGTRYYKGDTILEFTNNLDQEKTVLGQYDQEGTEVYRNIMYRIKCYQGEAGEGKTKQLIQITGGYSPKTYDKETVCTDILYTHTKVYYNGKWHKAMYLVYDNPSIADCWKKKVGSLAITYAKPYWFLICTKAGLKYGNDKTYSARELIKSWSPDESINMTFKEYKIRSKTKLGKGSYEQGKYLVKTIPSNESLEVTLTINDDKERKDNVTLALSDTPYDFYNIRIEYGDNKWSLISINGHISYEKHNYKKDAIICSFSKDEQVSINLIDNNDKYEKQQELNNDYEETVYDIVGLPDATYITVKNQTIVKEVDPETGQTEKIYIDYDEKVINQEDQMPVDFYNIRFIYTSSDNKWTVYSQCDYIKYGGRTYIKGKSILSFGTDEYDPEDPHPEIHLEIKDETEKYEIEETTTYTVRSVQVGSISYRLWTSTIDKTIKVEKTVNFDVEPWITIRFYEAMYEPVTIDDLIFEFSNVDMKWYLKSNNDDLYCAGSNYKKGELIDYWDYEYIQNLKYITVLVSSPDTGIEIKKLSSGDVPYLNNDIDEVYDDGLKICHSSTKGLWEIISVNDETYHEGIQFLEGQVIVSFKDKTILDQFNILVKKIIQGEDEYDNVMYSCYTGVDLINGVTTLTINGMSWTDKTATEANKSVIITKQDARSMYGYIWQKEETPPPPIFDIFEFIVPNESYYDIYYWNCKVIGLNFATNNYESLYSTSRRYHNINYLGEFSGRAYFSFLPYGMDTNNIRPIIYWNDNNGNSNSFYLPYHTYPLVMIDINNIYCAVLNSPSYPYNNNKIAKYSIFDDEPLLLEEYSYSSGKDRLFPTLKSVSYIKECVNYDHYFYKNGKIVISHPADGWEFYNSWSTTYATFNIELNSGEATTNIENIVEFAPDTDLWLAFCEKYDQYNEYNRLSQLWAGARGENPYDVRSDTGHSVNTGITFLHNEYLYMYCAIQIRERTYPSPGSSRYTDTLKDVKCNLIKVDPSINAGEGRFEIIEDVMDTSYFCENIACLYSGNGARGTFFNKTIKFGDDYYVYIYESQDVVIIGGYPLLRIFKLEENGMLTKVKTIEFRDSDLSEEYFLVTLYNNQYDLSSFDWIRIYYDARDLSYNSETGKYEVGLLNIAGNKRNFYSRNGDYLMVKVYNNSNTSNPLYIYFGDPLFIQHPSNFAYFGSSFV